MSMFNDRHRHGSASDGNVGYRKLRMNPNVTVVVSSLANSSSAPSPAGSPGHSSQSPRQQHFSQQHVATAAKGTSDLSSLPPLSSTHPSSSHQRDPVRLPTSPSCESPASPAATSPPPAPWSLAALRDRALALVSYQGASTRENVPGSSMSLMEPIRCPTSFEHEEGSSVHLAKGARRGVTPYIGLTSSKDQSAGRATILGAPVNLNPQQFSILVFVLIQLACAASLAVLFLVGVPAGAVAAMAAEWSFVLLVNVALAFHPDIVVREFLRLHAHTSWGQLEREEWEGEGGGEGAGEWQRLAPSVRGPGVLARIVWRVRRAWRWVVTEAAGGRGVAVLSGTIARTAVTAEVRGGGGRGGRGGREGVCC